MPRSTTKLRKRRWLRGLLAAAFLLALWQGAAWLAQKELLVAPPLRVLERLAELVRTADFWLSAGSSILRVMGGFALAVAAGFLLALLTAFVPVADALLSPLIGAVRATPVASFILLALVFMGAGSVPLFISFLMVLPIVWGNVREGLRRADAELLEMARVFAFGRKKLFLHIYLPALLPYLTAAWTSGLGFAWKAGISAEVLGVTARSIGQHLHEAKIYLETEDLFAWTLVVILLSVLLEKTLRKLVSVSAVRNKRGGRHAV